MFFITFLLILTCRSVLSIEIKSTINKPLSTRAVHSSTAREKRQIPGFTPVLPDEVKEDFKEYAKSYLNSMVKELSTTRPGSKKSETPVGKKRARICAEVCQHRCLPSCEWSCCIKENIAEYRTAHLVKPLKGSPKTTRKSKVSASKKNQQPTEPEANKRAHFATIPGDEATKDGSQCNLSCKRYCTPSCRFACCQPVQIKGVVLF